MFSLPSATIGEEITRICHNLDNDQLNAEGRVILVTGGAGFLGSWVCDVLHTQGATIFCIDNLSSGYLANIAHLKGKNRFNFQEHDISKPLYIDDEEIDVVLHMASRADPFMFQEHPIAILKANTLGTWTALGLAKRHSARLVFTSSSEIYGNPSNEFIPTPETYNGNVSPIGARSCYDEAKRAGEAFVVAYRLEHQLDSVILRVFNTYGPRMRPGEIYYGRVVPNFIKQALNEEPITVFGDGTQTRSFIYVSDEVEAIIRATLIPETSGEVINIGNNQETRIIDLARLIRKFTHSNSNIELKDLPEDDPLRRCPKIDKAKQLLNWQPSTPFSEGLQQTIAWYREMLQESNGGFF
ncbi:MAG: NAD-dependent epimerase/dehydratase family protein [Candidatus Heimdallarchaeota archaeon]